MQNAQNTRFYCVLTDWVKLN
ncbi:hypothetical protein PCAR4_310008 [Paraburkholderia caribensis]|nr:hypothetical protein BCAR13_1920024 [Paraburkholderia caribensis]CAG9252329.1 hypothetical protein PCAR4_310008 [Paraburkholderia caribensis]